MISYSTNTLCFSRRAIFYSSQVLLTSFKREERRKKHAFPYWLILAFSLNTCTHGRPLTTWRWRAHRKLREFVFRYMSFIFGDRISLSGYIVQVGFERVILLPQHPRLLWLQMRLITSNSRHLSLTLNCYWYTHQIMNFVLLTKDCLIRKNTCISRFRSVGQES